jgi:thiamine-phosphate pyrophosphorylase
VAARWRRAPDVLTVPRLYAILDADACSAQGLDPREIVDGWLEAGVRLIQLRAKSTPSGQFLTLAETLAASASAAGATFIVNDRADIASLAGASGVHVGQTDLSPTDARVVLGNAAVVGVSTHNAGQTRLALAEPVDYVAIGPVFRTASKDRPDPVVGLEGVREALAILTSSGRPLVAIGGITLERAPAVIEAGADSVAVISDLLSGGDPATRARVFLAALA